MKLFLLALLRCALVVLVACGGRKTGGSGPSGAAPPEDPVTGKPTGSGEAEPATSGTVPTEDPPASGTQPVRASAWCPPGPYPPPSVTSTTAVCLDFALRYSWSEGPTWVAAEHAFFFSNFTAGSPNGGDIIKYTPGAGCETFIADAGCNGLAVSAQGHLLAACQQSRSIVQFDLVTKEATTLADRYQGMLLDSPNDLVAHSNGTIYFTNPTFELGGRPPGVGQAVFRLDPGGSLELIARSPCNGIALSPDESKLYVIQAGVWDIDVNGVPSNRTTFFTGGDGMAVDCAGDVYASGRIFSRDGQRLGEYGAGTNLAFGGDDGRTVLVAGPGRQLRELQMSVPGLP